MNQLFDTSPTEDQDSKKKRPSKRKAAEPAAPEPASVDDALEAVLNRPGVILGRLDNHIACHRCLAACHDIVDDGGKEWQIECCFCGLREDIPAIEGYLQPRANGFVFRDGRFAGKAIEEVALDRRGMEYITWASKEHKRPSVREACAKFLLTASPAVG